MSRERSTSGVGFLYEGRDPDNRRYLGTCFSFYSPKLFITAAHCIKDIPLDRLWVNHVGGPASDLFERVQDPIVLDQVDLAYFFTDSPGAKWARSFKKTKYSLPLGEEVCVFGFPQEIFGPDPTKPTLRMLRGFYQRPFLYRRPPIIYSALELSFPCPEGFSGSPVFLERDPDTVVGIVTGNYEAYTIVDSTYTTGGKIESETRKFISYGCASSMFNLVVTFKNIFPEKFGIDYPDPHDKSFVE